MPESFISPRIALTPGEPAGVGPDITLGALQQPYPAEIVVVADPQLLQERARLLGLDITLTPFDPTRPPQPHTGEALLVLPVQQMHTSQPGQLDVANANYVLKTLKSACQGCLSGEYHAMVTAPVHKGIINEAGFAFTGHTEYLASLCGEALPVMMLANERLRVALMTTHLALSEVSQSITPELIDKVIAIVWRDLKERFGLKEPRLMVCGLNPHAGEGGHLGREELEIISPTLERCRQRGVDIQGPVPADTAFTPSRLNQSDVVIAMYHDQGLPVLKSQGFGETVNITLGLPIIRTSVDHGTALELAGTGEASSNSLVAAINSAIDIVGRSVQRATYQDKRQTVSTP